MEDIEKDPNCSTSLLYKVAIAKNVQFLRHYKNLHKSFTSYESCSYDLRNDFRENIKTSINRKAQNLYSTHNDYIKINKNLCTPSYYQNKNFSEHDRTILTKYRTGSHFLAIQTGRHTNTPRNERTCKCKELQTLQHIIFNCNLTNTIRNDNYPNYPTDLYSFFNDNPTMAAQILRSIEDKLGLR